MGLRIIAWRQVGLSKSILDIASQHAMITFSIFLPRSLSPAQQIDIYTKNFFDGNPIVAAFTSYWYDLQGFLVFVALASLPVNCCQPADAERVIRLGRSIGRSL